MRSDWSVLPDNVTKRVAGLVGGTRVIPAPGGDHAEIAATVAGPRRRTFVKAARTGHGVRSLRYEVTVNTAVGQPYAAALEWVFETDGWLVAGFEHCDGRHADLSPGSADLDLVRPAVTRLGQTPAPAGRWMTPQARLGFTHPALQGDVLVHSDLNPANLIITAEGLRIVDWAFATRTAAWVELALLAPWLIGAGHTPRQADQWLAAFELWGAIERAVLDEFAEANAAKWSRKAEQSTDSWVHDLAAWTSQWSRFRRESRPPTTAFR